MLAANSHPYSLLSQQLAVLRSGKWGGVIRMQQEEYHYPKLWILVFCLVAFGCLPAGPKAKEDKTTGLRPQSRYTPHFCFVL